MTDTSPAAELQAAATYVRLVAEANRAIAENRRIPVEMQGRTRCDVARADMHPAVGMALADWLADEAEQLERDNFPGIHRHALAVARQINGNPS